MTMVATSRAGGSACPKLRLVALAISLALVSAACGGSDGGSSAAPAIDLTQDSTLDDAGDQTGDSSGADTADTADPPTPVPAETPTTTPEPPAEERSIEDVQASTIRIAAQGTFQPVGESGQLVSAWSGTGFIIDESGIAVTNNHVVTGAALLEVTIPGIEGTLNAVVLGRSECSDLAVIDIEGDGYQALQFRTAPVTPGLSVFAAGYPGSGIDGGRIENRDYTVTGGVVSNTTGTGDTQGSSVEVVIEHDAKIRGGNSGGPLVDEQARVVGINYFGGDLDDFNLAIGAQAALPIIQQLRSGDVESIGINAEAVVGDGFSGVWVQGVESGSAADRAGVQPGDIILTMEGLPMATDGTLASYCDVVRSHSSFDVIEIEVLRLSTDELLTGQLNGTPLARSFSFAQELADEMGAGNRGQQPPPSADDYEFIADDTNRVGVEVPVTWVERDGSPADFGPSIYASPDLDRFNTSFDVPGILVEVNYDLRPSDHGAVLDIFDFSADCTFDSRNDFTGAAGVFTGLFDVWSNCAGTETGLLTLAASPPDGSLVVRMLVQITTQADLDALDRALRTFDAVSG